MSTEGSRRATVERISDKVVEHEARKMEILESIRNGVGMLWGGHAANLDWVGGPGLGWTILNGLVKIGVLAAGLAVIYWAPFRRWHKGRR